RAAKKMPPEKARPLAAKASETLLPRLPRARKANDEWRNLFAFRSVATALDEKAADAAVARLVKMATAADDKEALTPEAAAVAFGGVGPRASEVRFAAARALALKSVSALPGQRAEEALYLGKSLEELTPHLKREDAGAVARALADSLKTLTKAPEQHGA